MELPKTKRYPTYKDTSVDWLGEIPGHWKFARMKRLFSDYSEKNKPDEELLSVTQTQGVVPRSLVENRMVMPNGNLETFKYIQKGDFAISLRSFEGGLEYSNYNGIISPAYTVLRLKIQVKHAFFKYLFKSNSFIQELQTSVVGIREGKNISYPELSYSFLPIPSLSEQKQIADYLDKKTGQIDIAINQKEQMIELLKERKQILINRAVTRGLNPDVLLKDSGIEWIGQIPKHWEVRKLKYLLNGRLRYGANESGIEYDKELPRYVRITDLNQDGNLNEDSKLSLSFDKASEYLLNDGDILFARSGATVGKTYQFKRTMSIENIYCYAGYLIKAEPNEVLIYSDFLYLYTNSYLFNKWKNEIFIKATIENIGADKYSQLLVILPPLSEQKEILEDYNLKVEKINRAIAQKQQEIEKLKEYKATLIDSAVTGKICLSD